MSQPDFERLVDSLIHENHLPIVVTRGEDGLVVYANEAYVRNQGKQSAADVVGKLAIDLKIWGSEDERIEWRDYLRHVGASSRRFDYTNDDGTPGATVLSAQVLRVDDVDYFVSYNFDITPLLQRERRALLRLNRAQEIAKIGDFNYSAETRLLTGSAQLSDILEYDMGEGIETREMLERVHPDDLLEFREVLNSDPDEYSTSIRYLRRSGDEIWIEMIGSVQRDLEGRMMRWDGTIQDVTERKRAEMEQERLNEKMQAAQQLESLGLLAGGVAHDFNNLLVGILGNADFALMEEGIPKGVRDRLNDIVMTAQRAADLTNQLLAYSGKGRFVIQPTNLSTLVREMSELLKISVSKKCRLQLFLDDDLPSVEVDQTQIRQVVMNLIMNASEAIEHNNGLISVKTTQQNCSLEYLKNADLSEQIEPGRYVVVEVSDNGRGMSGSIRERLFEPFFTTKFSGRGLGMSAVMGIVRGHRGGIKIYSEEDRGTSFKVLLPASTLTAVVDPADDETGTIAGESRTILVVDDDPLVWGLLQRALEGMGFSVCVAEDGVAGLETFESNPHIDLVLLDLTMPKLDGVTTFHRMRESRPGIKAILMSGYNEQDATQEFVGKGLAGFLHKPFRIADLERVIKEIL